MNLKAYLNNVSDYGQESHHLMPSGFCEEVYQSKYNQKTEITEKFEQSIRVRGNLLVRKKENSNQ